MSCVFNNVINRIGDSVKNYGCADFFSSGVKAETSGNNDLAIENFEKAAGSCYFKNKQAEANLMAGQLLLIKLDSSSSPLPKEEQNKILGQAIIYLRRAHGLKPRDTEFAYFLSIALFKKAGSQGTHYYDDYKEFKQFTNGALNNPGLGFSREQKENMFFLMAYASQGLPFSPEIVRDMENGLSDELVTAKMDEYGSTQKANENLIDREDFSAKCIEINPVNIYCLRINADVLWERGYKMAVPGGKWSAYRKNAMEKIRDDYLALIKHSYTISEEEGGKACIEFGERLIFSYVELGQYAEAIKFASTFYRILDPKNYSKYYGSSSLINEAMGTSIVNLNKKEERSPEENALLNSAHLLSGTGK